MGPGWEPEQCDFRALVTSAASLNALPPHTVGAIDPSVCFSALCSSIPLFLRRPWSPTVQHTRCQVRGHRDQGGSVLDPKQLTVHREHTGKHPAPRTGRAAERPPTHLFISFVFPSSLRNSSFEVLCVSQLENQVPDDSSR